MSAEQDHVTARGIICHGGPEPGRGHIGSTGLCPSLIVPKPSVAELAGLIDSAEKDAVF
jgi:hypothetical protein